MCDHVLAVKTHPQGLKFKLDVQHHTACVVVEHKWYRFTEGRKLACRYTRSNCFQLMFVFHDSSQEVLVCVCVCYTDTCVSLPLMWTHSREATSFIILFLGGFRWKCKILLCTTSSNSRCFVSLCELICLHHWNIFAIHQLKFLLKKEHLLSWALSSTRSSW